MEGLTPVFNDFIVTCIGNMPTLTKLIRARRWSALNIRVYVISKDTWPNLRRLQMYVTYEEFGPHLPGPDHKAQERCILQTP